LWWNSSSKKQQKIVSLPSITVEVEDDMVLIGNSGGSNMSPRVFENVSPKFRRKQSDPHSPVVVVEQA
jgi:hypothetical protein